MSTKKVTTKNKKTKIVLLDAYAIIHRAYHALPDFSSSKTGEPTGALYGLSAMLMKIISDMKPDHIIACFDLHGATYRHELFADYKANRKEKDEDLSKQIDRSRDLFTVFNIPIYEAKGFEADDVLGAIVEQTKDNKDIEIIIASGDMDTLQLVDKKKVKVFTLRKGINDTITYDEKAVKDRFGFGPELIPDYKAFRGDPSDNIPGIVGIGEKTATQLITTFGGVDDVYKKLEKDEEAFEKKGIKKRIVGLLKEGKEDAEFSKMLATIRRDVPIAFKVPEKSWEEGFEVSEVFELFKELGFRTLTTRVKDLFGGEVEEEEKDTEDVSEKELQETAIALWVLDSNITKPTRDDILSYAKVSTFSEAKKKIFSELKKQKTLTVFEDIEKPLIPILEKMKKRGVKINVEFLKELSKEYHKDLEKIQKEIYKEAGQEFNINSPKQLGEILFDVLELSTKGQKKTAGGARSTRESELVKLKEEHSIIEKVLEYRELQKLLSTYIDNIPAMLEKGRLHATFLQAGTTTGRMSSNDPNLQNIPIKTEKGRVIRNAFVASKGHVLAALDYSQIELRVAAIMSGDKRLLEIFKNGEDVHNSVASSVFEVAPDEVTKEMRRRAKVINFGILYGMGVNALKANLGTDRKEAQQFYNAYFKSFSGLEGYLEEIKADARKSGYTETLFNRRRYFAGIDSPLPYIRAQAERMAINAPIQGTAADILKIAMKDIDGFLTKEKLEKDVHMLMQVHDELVFEITKEKALAVVPKIKKIMESVLTEKQSKGVPIIANTEVGDNWGEMKEI